MSKTKPGMPSPALIEDDVRRIAADVFREVMEEYYGSLADRLLAKFKALPQATDKEPAEEIVNRLDRIDKTNKAIREKYGLPDLPKETADEGSRTPHATEDDVRRIVKDEMDIVLGAFYKQQMAQQIAVIEACGYKVIRQPATDKETADEGSRTPHATEEEVGVYSDVPPYE